MRLSETQLRRMIRKELLKEMHEMEPEEKEGIHAGAIAGGLATGGALGAITYLLDYVQTHPIGHEIAMKIQQLSDAVQSVIQEQTRKKHVIVRNKNSFNYKRRIKKVLNENAGREQAAQLIAAMNQIRGNYDSMNIGQTVPAYKTDADVYMIKDFINQNVSGAVVDDYLEKLRTILADQNLQLDYSTDDYSEDGYVTSLNIY